MTWVKLIGVILILIAFLPIWLLVSLFMDDVDGYIYKNF